MERASQKKQSFRFSTQSAVSDSIYEFDRISGLHRESLITLFPEKCEKLFSASLNSIFPAGRTNRISTPTKEEMQFSMAFTLSDRFCRTFPHCRVAGHSENLQKHLEKLHGNFEKISRIVSFTDFFLKLYFFN